MDQNLTTSQSQQNDFVVHTFGCKVNTYDGGLIQKNMATNGFKLGIGRLSLDNLDKAKTQIHILNTCAVTAEATKEAVKTIRKIKAQQPFSTIVVTGCAAQVDTGAFENLPGADLVIANSHKGLLPDLLKKHFRGELQQKTFKSNIFKKEELEADGGEEASHTRTFLKIQDGCNSFCSFCIIPYARGKSRSISIAHIVEKVNQVAAEGKKEVVLTGVHIGDYEDNGKNMDDLVEAVLAKTTISRIRLSSLEPIEISDRLLAMYENPRLCAHFHMSIQSADTETLHQMKRKYSENEVEVALHKISKVKDVFVGMDVIAGFPSETEEQFENTYKRLSETPWTRLHVFPYSERSGTRAAIMDQVPHHVRKERAARLRELSLHRFQAEALKQVGNIHQTLILNKASRKAEGLTRNYWPVRLNLSEEKLKELSGREVQVKITGVNFETGEGQLEGVIL
ncbi:tRNA (N(6)-L-threonylcarbamoyladenosine(37)-C(2))-methylthiotransferase MtaB [Pseudobdellovibrio sp. HCB154]|uniref:tRNA (N(6)-L-threonylcarbamoyladenosine(37)-C(2))- methylthiotransferase MtaB n=1 Tax=Pseudobdellovibrio sp. HCB154 TaxID=3386277 RepID=UPI003916E142